MECLTAIKWNFSITKMKHKQLLLLILLLIAGCPYILKAQTFELLFSFPVDPSVAVTSDTYGRLYLASHRGEISSYSPKGEFLHVYSPQSAAYFSTLDARGLQLAAFDENSQQLVFLDRFLNLLGSELLPPDLFSYATALSWSAGNSVWVADAGTLQLKKWKPGSRELEATINLSQFGQEGKLEIVALKEYQHKLYLFTTSQLYVFDRLGTYEKKLPLPEWAAFSFAGDQLMLLTEQSLLRFPLYGGDPASLSLPEGRPFTHFQFGEGIYFFFKDGMATAWKLLPQAFND